MIEFQNVTVVYPQNRAALRSVSLSISAGEFVFLVGTTGAGKSTLLKLLYREMTPTQGTVRVLGMEPAKLRPRDVPLLRRRMGVVFQDFGLLPNKTVFENVAFALRVLGLGRREVRRRVAECLDLVGMTHRCDAFPHQISGGEQQRVAIARALANRPALLLADEPTGNLDPDTSHGVAQVLADVNRGGTTVVVSTHDQRIVDTFRRRVVALENGVLVRDEAAAGYDRAASTAGPQDPAQTLLPIFESGTSDAAASEPALEA
jgi:cell division transport system ATP-binding protein